MNTLKTVLWVTALLSSMACRGYLAADEPMTKQAGLDQRLRYAPIQPATEQALVALPAVVTINPRHRIELSPPAEGRVVALLVEEGTSVAEGTELARLQIPEMTDWDQIEKASQAKLDAALQGLELARERLRHGLGTRTEVQAALAGYSEASMNLQQLQAARRAGERSGLTRDRDGLTLIWRAPRAGILSRIHVREGEGISPQSKAFSMIDASQAEVMVRVPERLLGMLDNETKLAWRPAGTPRSADDFLLNFVRRDAVVDPESRTVACYFQPEDNMDTGSAFMAGRSGRGILRTQAETGLWRVPRSAVCQLMNREGVFVARTESETPPFHEVEVIGRLGDELIIRSEHLAEGNRVVVAGTFLLKSIVLLREES